MCSAAALGAQALNVQALLVGNFVENGFHTVGNLARQYRVAVLREPHYPRRPRDVPGPGRRHDEWEAWLEDRYGTGDASATDPAGSPGSDPTVGRRPQTLRARLVGLPVANRETEDDRPRQQSPDAPGPDALGVCVALALPGRH